ncbi:hypothetical protein C8Q78DRAFT_436781 [Trametes maxima]|nr:hypothetical protein C8Q78DRAFT_436781 [Trametes maxima]
MLYFHVGSQLELKLDSKDGRYGLSLSHNDTAYPVASMRGAIYPPSEQISSTTPSMSTPRAISSSMEGRSHLNYPIPDMHEITSGVLSSGQWTVNHPLVDTYLAALTRLAPKQKPQQGPGASAPATAATSPAVASHALPDAHAQSYIHAPQSEAEKTRWRAHNGGIASVYTVAQVITVQYELFPGAGSAWYAPQVPRLSEEKRKAVFALAALKVLNHPTHPAHWAMWAKNIHRRTAQVVDEVFQLRPCPIVSHVSWLGLPENIWALQGLQSAYIPPPPPQAEKPKAGNMTLRKRKAPAASSASSSLLPEEGAPLRVSPRKRQRTTRAQAAAAQAQQDALAAGAALSEAGSMLLDVPPPTSGAGGVSKATKQESLDIAGVTPALQPLGLPLVVPEAASVSTGPAARTATRSQSAASMSPSAPRRSERARRKPAQGPVTLSTPSVSTPLSALSTPESSSGSLPSQEQDGRPRAGSCGSSTAVSESGEASEGTVVDADVDYASIHGDGKGKRKAIELEADDTEHGPAGKPQGATPAAPKGGKKGRSSAASSRSRKRTKTQTGGGDVTEPPPHALNANGEENVRAVGDATEPAPVAQTTKKRRTTSGGGAAGKRKAAPSAPPPAPATAPPVARKALYA